MYDISFTFLNAKTLLYWDHQEIYITKDSHYSSMRQQFMYMIYLYQGDTPVSFTSHPTPSLKYPRTTIPLVFIPSSHPNCEYTCDCPQDKNMEFPLLPVIFVDVKCQLLQVNCLYFLCDDVYVAPLAQI